MIYLRSGIQLTKACPDQPNICSGIQKSKNGAKLHCPKLNNHSWAMQGHYKGSEKRRRTRKTIDLKTGKKKKERGHFLSPLGASMRIATDIPE
jgi:hypothetical protein